MKLSGIFINIGLLWLLMLSTGHAQTTTAVIPGDFPDPTIIRTPKGYYAAGTSSEWAPHFPIYHSADLMHWRQVGNVFDKAPAWTAGSFWAPEYYHVNDLYYIYYTARRKSDNISCIGVASSKYPDHGFKDHGVVISCGKEAIDPFIYNDGGQLYITFKAYGLDSRPIELVARKLSANGLKAEGEIIPLLKDNDKKGMEGQCIFKKGNYYYLFYSAGDCCGTGCSYHVKVARAQSFVGPYEKYEGAEILQPADGWKCGGHGTIVQTQAGQYVYLCHAYNKESDVFTGRHGMLATVDWSGNDGWPKMRAFANETKLPNVHDKFMAKRPAEYWQYDFRNAQPTVKQANGVLDLSGTMLNGNTTGIIYGLRPVSDNFTVATTVSNHNNALKGLAFYGSVKAALGIGVKGNQIISWMVKDEKFLVIDSASVKGDKSVQLKISMLPDKSCVVSYSQSEGRWTSMIAGNPIITSFLPQWDRAPRVGLFFKGLPTENALFKKFDLENKSR